jgi:hypothetical protein
VLALSIAHPRPAFRCAAVRIVATLGVQINSCVCELEGVPDAIQRHEQCKVRLILIGKNIRRTISSPLATLSGPYRELVREVGGRGRSNELG